MRPGGNVLRDIENEKCPQFPHKAFRELQVERADTLRMSGLLKEFTELSVTCNPPSVSPGAIFKCKSSLLIHVIPQRTQIPLSPISGYPRHVFCPAVQRQKNRRRWYRQDYSIQRNQCTRCPDEPETVMVTSMGAA
jgi:hypothetical protein